MGKVPARSIVNGQNLWEAPIAHCRGLGVFAGRGLGSDRRPRGCQARIHMGGCAFFESRYLFSGWFNRESERKTNNLRSRYSVPLQCDTYPLGNPTNRPCPRSHLLRGLCLGLIGGVFPLRIDRGCVSPNTEGCPFQ